MRYKLNINAAPFVMSCLKHRGNLKLHNFTEVRMKRTARQRLGNAPCSTLRQGEVAYPYQAVVILRHCNINWAAAIRIAQQPNVPSMMMVQGWQCCGPIP